MAGVGKIAGVRKYGRCRKRWQVSERREPGLGGPKLEVWARAFLAGAIFSAQKSILALQAQGVVACVPRRAVFLPKKACFYWIFSFFLGIFMEYSEKFNFFRRTI